MKYSRKTLLVFGAILIAIGFTTYFFNEATKTIDVPEIALTAEWEFKVPDDDPNYSLYRASAIRYQSGYLYVCDEGANRIMKYDESGKFKLQIGRTGQGPGELLRPIGIAVHPDGSVFVLDRGNGRIQVFDSLGRYMKSFKGSMHLAGTRIGQRIFDIDEEKRIFIPSGTAFPGLLSVYSVDGIKVGEVGKKLNFSSQYRPWQRNNEINFTIGLAGDLYVQFHSNPILRKYKSNGQLLWERDFSKLLGVRQAMAGMTEMENKEGSSEGGSSLKGFTFFIESVSDRMLIVLMAKQYLVDENSYYPIRELRFYNAHNDEIFPYDIARGSAGKLYVLDGENHILRYSLPTVLTTLNADL